MRLVLQEVLHGHRSAVIPFRSRSMLCRVKGELVLTGQLGDVMKESAQAGISLYPFCSSQIWNQSGIFPGK